MNIQTLNAIYLFGKLIVRLCGAGTVCGRQNDLRSTMNCWELIFESVARTHDACSKTKCSKCSCVHFAHQLTSQNRASARQCDRVRYATVLLLLLFSLLNTRHWRRIRYALVLYTTLRLTFRHIIVRGILVVVMCNIQIKQLPLHELLICPCCR